MKSDNELATALNESRFFFQVEGLVVGMDMDTVAYTGAGAWVQLTATIRLSDGWGDVWAAIRVPADKARPWLDLWQRNVTVSISERR
jgi:hypothetical protein